MSVAPWSVEPSDGVSVPPPQAQTISAHTIAATANASLFMEAPLTCDETTQLRRRARVAAMLRAHARLSATDARRRTDRGEATPRAAARRRQRPRRRHRLAARRSARRRARAARGLPGLRQDDARARARR